MLFLLHVSPTPETYTFPYTTLFRSASACRHPERVAGYHFFNPVPLMKIVEVVRGELTRPEVVARLERLAREAGHFPALTPDTPGFLVNHAGRAYVPEALRLRSEERRVGREGR